MTIWLLLALAGFVQTALASSLLMPLAIRLGRAWGLVDNPGPERKIHTEPTPRSGGIAIVAAFWGCLGLDIAAAVWLVPHLGFLPEAVRHLGANVPSKLAPLGGIAAGALMVFALGLADDRFSLSARVRLVVQMAAVLPLILAGVQLQLFLPAPLGAAATVLWLTTLTNSFNFLDNMNGLTSGIAIVVCAVMALLSLLAREFYMVLMFAMLAGAGFGFWRVNFFRGGVFLGDGGSTHFGFLIGALMVLCTYYESGVPSRLPVLTPLLVLAVPLFDIASVLWIRWRTGKPLMEGDRNHFSHRLVDLGFSRRDAVLVIYGFTLMTGLAAVALRQLDWRHGLAQAAMVALLFAIIHKIERVSRARVKGV
jgi:UDP-GlcNAc:undecaprenyl-phosphate GlcNAc-1-phosphate transferase